MTSTIACSSKSITTLLFVPNSGVVEFFCEGWVVPFSLLRLRRGLFWSGAQWLCRWFSPYYTPTYSVYQKIVISGIFTTKR